MKNRADTLAAMASTTLRLATSACLGLCLCLAAVAAERPAPDYRFDGNVSERVLRSYLARAVTAQDLLTGKGDVDDNLRVLKRIGAKFAGRAIYLWGAESQLPGRLDRARAILPKVRTTDDDLILQAAIFEIVTTDVEKLAVPAWALEALGMPVVRRNFRYADMLFPDGTFVNHWRPSQSVPDITRDETKLWFYFLAATYIDAGCEALHFGQYELIGRNDRRHEHWARLLSLVRDHAAKKARRRWVLIDAHVPSGGPVRDGRLLLDFHSFPLRIEEVPDKPQEGRLRVGFADSFYGRSKGGITPSGWRTEHLPYLVEVDNWGVSRRPGQARVGGVWIWGYDEITWFAHQPREYRDQWLAYAHRWVREHDEAGYLQMPVSRTVHHPVDGKIWWYFANDPSPATPTGFGQEAAIEAIWKS